MKKKEILQAAKFTLFSISAGIVQAGSFFLLHDVLGLESYWLSHVPSLVLSVLWNFTFNRKYTFKPTGTVKRDMLLVALYYVVFTPATALWGSWLEKLGIHDWIIEIINMLINFVTEFLFQKLVVYPEKTED
jgi:putative flippase GtrA